MPKNLVSHKVSSEDATLPSFVMRRGFILLVFVAIVLGGVVMYGGRAWVILVTDLLLEGCFLGCWLGAAVLGGGFIVERCRLPRAGIARSLWFCTAAAVGLGLMGLVVLGLGLAGWLNHATATGVLVVLALPQLVVMVRRGGSVNIRTWLRGGAPAAWLGVLAGPFVAMTLTGAMLPPGLLWKDADDPHPYDVLEYHLQVPREWYEAGRIVPLEHNVFSYFPMNAEMHDLLAMYLRGGPWEGMYLAQLMGAAFMGLAVVAVYGTCRTLGGSRGGALLGASMAGCTPWTALLAPVAYVESEMLLYATLAIGWGLVACRSEEGRTGRMVLAGVLAGLACGVKYTAVPMVLMTIPAALLIWRPRMIGPVVAFVLAGLLAFSPWLIRNAAWAQGNPIFPEGMRQLGHAHFSADQMDRWERAHEPRADQRSLAGRGRAAVDQIVLDWRYGYALLPLALAAGAIGWRRPEARMLLSMLLAIAGIWLFATHLQSRFFVLAIPICAMLVGIAPMRLAGEIAVTIILVGAAAVGFGRLNKQIAAYLGPFGVTDFKEVMPPAYVKLAEEGRNIGLVGEGQIFWYQIPMARLSYRTVFDVDASGASDPITPWLGKHPRADQWLLIYPSELERFSRTYAHVPPPPADLLGQREPVVLPPR